MLWHVEFRHPPPSVENKVEPPLHGQTVRPTLLVGARGPVYYNASLAYIHLEASGWSVGFDFFFHLPLQKWVWGPSPCVVQLISPRRHGGPTTSSWKFEGVLCSKRVSFLRSHRHVAKPQTKKPIRNITHDFAQPGMNNKSLINPKFDVFNVSYNVV